ncbi:MAG: helix-turn-helix domain-containing protein [Bacteroidota bacterium]
MDYNYKIVVLTANEVATLVQTSVRLALSEHNPKTSVDDNKPMSVDEASEFLGLPKNTIYQFTSKRILPHKKIGRRIVFFKSELLAWLETRNKKTKIAIEAEGFGMKGQSR